MSDVVARRDKNRKFSVKVAVAKVCQIFSYFSNMVNKHSEDDVQ